MQPSATTDDKATPHDFLVGEWRVAPPLNLLVRGDSQVRLEPRVMDVLVQLAKCAGEVVSKEELVENVWQGRYVTDDALSVAIYSLRRSLGDDARRPRYVETVARRGYRLIASVRPGTSLSTGVQPETTEATRSSRTG
jgi:DNA-binding winged helix-turn-helix (wHTH) protein